MAKLLLAIFLSFPALAAALPIAAPGDLRLRNDLQLLNDNGAIDVPLTTWPLSVADVYFALENIPAADASGPMIAAHQRLKLWARAEMRGGTAVDLLANGAIEPRLIRGFENLPRDEAQITATLGWLGERFVANLSATAVVNPFDEKRFRPDGTYVGVAIGNWMVTAGWQDRWWGPSRDSSLILSTNARPMPGVGLQRIQSHAPKSNWLRWMGRWTLSAFLTEMEEDRVVRRARALGIRGTIRPPGTGLEIGISRTAQWCGDARPCDIGVFTDLLLGNDNRGVNIDPESEPGNQLGGFDIRWRLPRKLPFALYMQWIGEDGRPGGGAIGSWMRQLGLESWGTIGDLTHRTHIEVSDSMCREGGFGFSFEKPNCAYEHTVYRTGYRYRGKALGHAIDGDGRSYSIGSTLVQSGGQTWSISFRRMNINRAGPANPQHTISATPQKMTDILLTHSRVTDYGRISVGLGGARTDDEISGVSNTDATAYLQWSTQ